MGDWPKNPVIYQIYPRSFQSTSATGEGDLKGARARLDHVASLGVDAIWLSPFYASPMCDGGYDVADHCAVDARFGTMGDFDSLLARAHDLGLRVMVDLVLNHTSDTHDWFAKSLAREKGFEDVYVWADAKPDGSPPSNWISFFGLPAWQWHPQRAQYCLHKFLPCQPCLNHYNDRVRDRLERVTKFWRDRGVDGFRYDAITSFFHDPEFKDNPPSSPEDQPLIPGPDTNPYTYQAHLHDVLPHDCADFCSTLREMAGPDAFLLGEVNNGPRSVEVLRAFTKPNRLDAGYTIDMPERGPSQALLAELLDRLDGAGGFAWWLSCHDQKRHISSLGDGSARDAKMFAALLCALPGPLMLFQGEELGQPQAELIRSDLHDPFDQMYWPDPMGRDGARAPFAWDDTRPCHGFSDVQPWLPIPHPEDGGAVQQDAREDSVLNFYRKALSLRRDLGLADGALALLEAPEQTIHAQIAGATGTIRLAVNLSHEPWQGAGRDTAPRLATTPLRGHTLPPRSAAWWRIDT